MSDPLTHVRRKLAMFAKKTGRVEWKNYNDMPAAFKKKLTQKLNLTPSSRIGN